MVGEARAVDRLSKAKAERRATKQSKATKPNGRKATAAPATLVGSQVSVKVGGWVKQAEVQEQDGDTLCPGLCRCQRPDAPDRAAGGRVGVRIYLVHEDVEGEHQIGLYQSLKSAARHVAALAKEYELDSVSELDAHSADWMVQVCAEAGEALP